MGQFVLLLVGVTALLVVYSGVKYLGRANNRLIEARENCRKAWSDIDVVLERRQSELENLIDVANEHVNRESALLDDLIQSRQELAETDAGDAEQVAAVLEESTEQALKLSEEVPELASDDRYDELVRSIREHERRIEDRRERYNETVRVYNSQLKRFPESVFANYRNMSRKQPFVASASAREGVDVGDQLDTDTR